MDVNFSLASQTLIVGAEAWSSFIEWDMEEDVHSYSVGWQKKEVISEREHSTVKSSITATALYHCNYIFQMQMIALRILPLVHRLQEQFGSYFSVGDKSRQRLRTGESHLLCLFPFLWRCLLGRNTANCRVIWRGFLTRVFCWQSCCCCLSSKESDLCVARRNSGAVAGRRPAEPYCWAVLLRCSQLLHVSNPLEIWQCPRFNFIVVLWGREMQVVSDLGSGKSLA